jgi:integrase
MQEQAYFLLCGIFDLAVADDLRKDNPAKSPIIAKPRTQVKERSPWDSRRVWSVIDAHPEPYGLIPTVLAGLGLREGEAFGLAEQDFDFQAGKVRIRRQVTRVGKWWVFKLPKGGKERTVPLSPGLARLVEAFIKEQAPRTYALPWMREDGELGDAEHACKLLFRWRGDDPRSHDRHIRSFAYDQVIWKPALAAAGVIPVVEPGPRGGSYGRYAIAREDGRHALRHYYATTLLDAGVSLAGVMEFMGHSKKGAPVTLGVYGHVTEETFAAARVAVDRALFRLRAVQDRQSGGTGTEQAAGQ